MTCNNFENLSTNNFFMTKMNFGYGFALARVIIHSHKFSCNAIFSTGYQLSLLCYFMVTSSHPDKIILFKSL